MASVRVLACGRTTSGKTEWLYRRYLRHEPRMLLVDSIGEWRSSRRAAFPEATYSIGTADTLDAIGAVADRDEWTIVADLDREELATVADVLAPRNIDESPVSDLGGMALMIDEVDLMVPLGDSRLSGLWRRGRHVGLSVYSATQRPASVNKETSAQCEIIGVLELSEPRDVAYLRERYGRNQAEAGIAWARSRPYRVACYCGSELFRLPPEPL